MGPAWTEEESKAGQPWSRPCSSKQAHPNPSYLDRPIVFVSQKQASDRDLV